MYQAIHTAIVKGQMDAVEQLLDEEGVSPRVQVKVHTTNSVVF